MALADRKEISKLADFTRHYADPEYDRVNNPLRRPVAELLPTAVSWSDSGRPVRVNFSTTGIARRLADLSGVAIVDSPFEKGKSKAYVVNADGSERFVLVKPANAEADAVVSDAYYVNGVLSFFLSGSSGDRRVECDAATGQIRRVIEAR